jgi:hypothetical protein
MAPAHQLIAAFRLPATMSALVIRVRVRPAAAPAMSVMPRKRRSATKMESVAMGHVWTAPAVQEESDVLRSVRVQPCIRPVFEWRSDLHCDAAAVAAGPDVIR